VAVVARAETVRAAIVVVKTAMARKVACQALASTRSSVVDSVVAAEAHPQPSLRKLEFRRSGLMVRPVEPRWMVNGVISQLRSSKRKICWVALAALTQMSGRRRRVCLLTHQR